ncbi:hypothetical protein PZC41_14525 [Staphylococcus aureus]|uniref:hypothetical protein n=1 Tax=Staphylococcus aureus TaxID=1280 RepID=UPI0023B1B225|nr:hypothetical protein [Staphylococcus aureus]MDE8535520.1 hypothetical protein [Staphylococcus aureus]
MKQVTIPTCPLCGLAANGRIADIATPQQGWQVICQAGAWCHIREGEADVIVFMVQASKKMVQPGLLEPATREIE